MTTEPVSPALLPNRLASVHVVATDMDGTLTRNGIFSAELIRALESLQEATIPVIIVTGRSAGWVQSVAHYLPVWGAIAENGGVVFAATDAPQLISPIPSIAKHRQQLAQTFQTFQTHFPNLKESADNRFRLTDWTFSVEGLLPEQINQLQAMAEAQHWSFTYSTVQCHIKPKHQTKAIALTQVLDQYFPTVPRSAVVTVGDSLNDESLFDRQLVPISVGVANVREYLSRLAYHPTYITQASEVEGFCELTLSILSQ
ncbi:MAG: HAD family hydrolase [Cyanobacteria bacterium J06626_14]